MAPSKVTTTAERLAILETWQTAFEEEHDRSLAQLSDRLEAHEMATKEHFAAIENVQEKRDVILMTISDNVVRLMEDRQNRKDKKLEWWQILAIVATFTGPTLIDRILKFFGG